MPPTQVVFYRDADRRAPVVEWLEDLRAADLSAYAKCRAAIVRLKEAGHELRRPTADFLRDGIYELRVRRGRVNYRLLYFFHGRSVAIVAHALTKEDVVPSSDIERAIRRKRLFAGNPDLHTFELE